ncbi:aldo/keto reductase [uncultured Megamonas sp.]|uniref:aldo/keto reductase n=1 Tax=uncultured Megamonas sp. TaxID=286140 RepID=UPI00259B3D24|nr:aldo/keto reductase [uncultured Megamonas sp.]
MEYVVLNNGLKMPKLGLGVYQITDEFECRNTVESALDIGYRLIDTAQAYHNEKFVGDAIKQSNIPREDLFITTKLWLADTGYKSTIKAFENSLKKLGLDYLDLYLIHQPIGDYYGSWKAMEELYEQGLIKAIGVANFMPDRLMDFICNNKILPAIDQVEVNPFCQRQIDEIMMKEKNVQMQSWGPFAEGRNNIFQNEVLEKIADKYQKSIAQIILRWLLQRNIVCIPKSVRIERLKENFNVFDFKLSNEDMNLISTLDTKKSCFFSHYDPKIIEWLCSMK